MIEKIPCTVTDPFNLPFRIAVNLIQNSYCKELPSLSESAAILTQGCLEYCLKSLDSLLTLENNNTNYININELFDISDSVYSVRDLFAPREVKSNELIQNDHYKVFVRQYLNVIDSASTKFYRISTNLHNKQNSLKYE